MLRYQAFLKNNSDSDHPFPTVTGNFFMGYTPTVSKNPCSVKLRLLWALRPGEDLTVSLRRKRRLKEWHSHLESRVTSEWGHENNGQTPCKSSAEPPGPETKGPDPTGGWTKAKPSLFAHGEPFPLHHGADISEKNDGKKHVKVERIRRGLRRKGTFLSAQLVASVVFPSSEWSSVRWPVPDNPSDCPTGRRFLSGRRRYGFPNLVH